jgi:hypothetical protein
MIDLPSPTQPARPVSEDIFNNVIVGRIFDTNNYSVTPAEEAWNLSFASSKEGL